AQRLLEFGPNALPPAKRAPWWTRLINQFKSALIYLLLFALIVDLLTWARAGANRLPVEALAVAGILLLNAGLGLLQEYRSERALEELAKLGAPKAWVLRDGVLLHLDVSNLVHGDVVRLDAGDRVPADGRAENATFIRVDESLLTGESVPVEKAEGDELLSGTLLVQGSCELLVTRTGPASAMGRLAGALSGIETGKTPLERSMDEFGTRIARYVGALSVLIVVGGMLIDGLQRFDQVLMFAVAFAVAIVPEGMPAVVTLVLSFGVQRMVRRNAVVRRLSAVEALGAVTVIASDKTGTLTLNRMAVGDLNATDEDEALRALTLANDADHASAAGDPLERGLFEFVQARGTDIAAMRGAHPRISSRPFDTRWKYMRVTVVMPSGQLKSYLKGALEVVLERAALPEKERTYWLAVGREAAERGFKVIGLGCAEGDRETELQFLGFVTLWDPPRPAALGAVRDAQAAGISVMMLTGDHPATALAIAASVGITSPRALTGAEIQQMTDAELASSLREVRVFSRLLPEHKLRIVAALQARGEVVAMTGDGLNDALALKQADVAVAMGERGSEVAREVSDLVLLDDDFATIVAAVEEGRMIYENLLSFVRFTFSSNVALAVLVLGGAIGSLVLGLRGAQGSLLLPLTALQILWINFLGDGPTALALSTDRCRGTMQNPPRARDRSLLDRKTMRFVLLDGFVKGALGLGLLLAMPQLGSSIAATATSVFLYEAVAKLLSAYPARKLGARPAQNAWLHGSVLVGVLLGLVCIWFVPVRDVLGLVPLSARELLFVCGLLLVTWGTGELAASVARRTNRGDLPAATPASSS
ncbi:MAG TPA: cation-translocating P-type ATPase, partial [Polyangiaceae bacterium]|nr:cation-translocating P-type ATPase [Polyangiaceae bacterium]